MSAALEQIAWDTEKPIDLFQLLELEERLSEWTGGRVDLVSKKALKLEIGKRISQGGNLPKKYLTAIIECNTLFTWSSIQKISPGRSERS